MALTYTPDEINQMRSHFQALRAPAPQQQQAPKGNFLTHLLPSIGGIGGGVGGGAIGGALAGSAILPGVGTAVGGLLGALAGGAIGGGAGKVGENAIEHQALGNGVAGQALENGVLSAGPLRLLKGAGVAGKVLAGIGDNSAAADVAAQGGGKLMQALHAGGDAATAPSMFKTAIANKLDNVAGNAAQKGLKINDSTFLSNFNKQAGESVGDFARRFGVPHNGLDSTVQNVLQPGFAAHADAVGQIGNIAKSDIMDSVKSQVADKLASPIPDTKAAGQAVIDKAQSVLENMPENISATDLNAIKSDLSGLVKNGVSDGPTMSHNQVLQTVGDAFRKTINQAADKAGVTVPADLSKLGYKSTNVGDLGHELNNLKTLLDKSEVKSWQGTGTNPVSLSGSAALGGFGGPAGLATGLGIQAINSGAGKKITAKGIDAVASRLDKAAIKSGTPYTAANIAKRVAPVGLLGALGTSNTQSSNNQMMTDPTMNNAPNNIDPLSNTSNTSASLNGLTVPQQQPTADPNDPFNPANISANVQNMIANGAKMSDVNSYLSMAQTMQKIQAAASPASAKPLNSTQQQQSFNAQSGLSSLQDIAAALQKNPNEAKLAALPGGGLTSSLTGTGSYKAAISNATDVIGRLRSGGAIGTEEEKQFKSLLPQTFDTPQTAAYKLNQLQTLFSQFANPQAASSDTTDLLTALGGQ